MGQSSAPYSHAGAFIGTDFLFFRQPCLETNSPRAVLKGCSQLEQLGHLAKFLL